MGRFGLFIKTRFRLIIFIIALIAVAVASVIGLRKSIPAKKPENSGHKTVTVINEDGGTRRAPNFVNTEDQEETETGSGKDTSLSEGTDDVGSDVISPDVTYILNKSKHKFHLPTCSSVSRIADRNKEEFKGTRDEIIADGYEPCKVCNP